MRKFIALASILLITIAGFYFSACNSSSTEPQAISKEDSLKNVIARGKYLAHHVAACMDCHSQRDFSKFSGPEMPGSEGAGGLRIDEALVGHAIPGVLYTKNITPDPETGIGSWTDDEVLRAMTQGISKNGDTLFPLMPYVGYNAMAKEDLLSIIAYLRTIKPVKNAVPPRQLMVPISMVYPAPMLRPSIDNNVRPPESDTVKYGEYLITMANCIDCHTQPTPQGPDMSRMYAGGFTFNLPSNKVTTSNITPDSATGIGAWTADMFVERFKYNSSDEYMNHDPANMNTIMPWGLLGKMEEKDLRAIYAYLRTVPAISNKIEKYPK